MSDDKLSAEQLKLALKSWAAQKADAHKGFVARAAPAAGMGLVTAVAFASEFVKKNEWIAKNWYARGGLVTALGYWATTKSNTTTEDGIMFGRIGWALLALGAFTLYQDNAAKKTTEETKGPEDETTERPRFSLLKRGEPTPTKPREFWTLNPQSNTWERGFFWDGAAFPERQTWNASRQQWQPSPETSSPANTNNRTFAEIYG